MQEILIRNEEEKEDKVDGDEKDDIRKGKE